MFGFFDKKIYRNDDTTKNKIYKKFLKSNKIGNDWYDYLNHEYWHNEYANSVFPGGCTKNVQHRNFVPADDFSCYYLLDNNDKICGLALKWLNNLLWRYDIL